MPNRVVRCLRRREFVLVDDQLCRPFKGIKLADHVALGSNLFHYV